MKITVSGNIDTSEVYQLCRPINQKDCEAHILEIVTAQCERRAFEPNGTWDYPSAIWIARSLITDGFAN